MWPAPDCRQHRLFLCPNPYVQSLPCFSALLTLACWRCTLSRRRVPVVARRTVRSVEPCRIYGTRLPGNRPQPAQLLLRHVYVEPEEAFADLMVYKRRQQALRRQGRLLVLSPTPATSPTTCFS